MGNMSERESSLYIQRVRCGQCQLPLLQMGETDLLYTLQLGGEDVMSQTLPAYSYRLLSDPTPLLVCPRCGAVLSPATVVVAPSITRME